MIPSPTQPTAATEPADPAPRAPAFRAGGRTARTKPAEVVLVCRKCAKRVGLSRKEALRLAKRAAKAMTKAAAKTADARSGAGAPRKAKVVETGCLGPCPKRLLAVATGASLAVGRVALLDPRADPPASLPDFGPNGALPAPAEAGVRSGEHGSAPDPHHDRPDAPIPT